MSKMSQIIGHASFDDSKVYAEDRVDLLGNKVKRLIIEGTAIVCDEPGINGRSYPLEIIRREVDKLNRTKVCKGRLAAELNHPRLDDEANPKDYPIFEMNLWKTCAIIEELRLDGKKLYCKMVVAEETQAGGILAGLLKAGYTPGYSLRGAGSTNNSGRGYEEIADDYVMITVDVVGNPSFDDKALITHHFESENKPKMSHKAIMECINNYSAEIVQHRKKDFRVGYNRYDAAALIEAIRR